VSRWTRRAFVHAAAAPVWTGWHRPGSGDPRRTGIGAGRTSEGGATDQSPSQQPPVITAQQLVERIRAAVGIPWKERTVDGFKAGDPAAVLTGVAVTVAAHLEHLRRAAAAGCNLVISHEPVFYSGNDEPGNRATDPVYLAKKAYMDEAKLVVWRFADHWNGRQPDPRVGALAAALSWTAGPRSGDGIYSIPETTLSALMAHLRGRLGIRGGMRAVGTPGMRVRSVLLSPGGSDLQTAVARLGGADVLIAGEPREWEVVPYVQDARENGAAKGLVAVGRMVSQEPGMRACADWLRTLAPELRVVTLPGADPYWNPAS
jgi:hypothetical protein